MDMVKQEPIKKVQIIKTKRLFERSGRSYESFLASFVGSYAIFVLLPFSFIFHNSESLELNSQVLITFIIYFICGCVFFVVLVLGTLKLIRVDLSPIYQIIFLYLFITAWIIPNNTGPLDGLRDGQVFTFGADTFYQLSKLLVINLGLIFIYYKNRKLFNDMVAICLIGSFFLVIYTSTNFQYETETKATTEVIKLADLSLSKNIIIISFDAIQGDILDKIFHQNPSLLNGFDGFTFYPNTASVAPNTQRSTFLTLTGSIPPMTATTKVWVEENKRKLLPAILESEGNYRISVYGPAIMIGGVLCRDMLKAESCFTYDAYFDQYGGRHHFNFRKTNESMFYSALRVLPPYLVKLVNNIFNRFIFIDDGLAMATKDVGKLSMGRPYYEYLELLENLTVKHASPVLTFQHFVFTHEPVTFDSSCAYINSENVVQNVESAKEQSVCVVVLMKKMISKLKKIGVYDNSMIFFISDHGMSARFNTESNINFGGFMPAARYNAFLMFKEFNSVGKAKISQAPVSLLDVALTVCNSAINLDYCDKQGYQGMDLRRQTSNKDRKRALIMYTGGKEVLGKDFSRYFSDLSLFSKGVFEGDIKNGLEKFFKNSHPDYSKEFRDEMILNGDFSSGLLHWTQRGNVETNADGVIINLTNHLFQDAHVDEEKTYLISYDISCASDAIMRAQINWFDANGTYLSATGELFNCYGNDIAINKIVKPPIGATVGRFYITANDERDIIVKSVSFRK